MAGVSKRSIVLDGTHRLGSFGASGTAEGFCCLRSRLLLLAQQHEIPTVLAAWQRVPHRQRLSPVDALRYGAIGAAGTTLLVAVSLEMRRDSSQRSLLQSLEMCDPQSYAVYLC